MNSAEEKARAFLTHEKAFRLGALTTESAHPKTYRLSQRAQADLADGVRLLQSVDDDILPAARRALQSEVFAALTEAMISTCRNRRRIFFTGCGATGRLSILLEACWRRFWRQWKRDHPEQAADLPDYEDQVRSVMAGGDYALIKAVEGFEDFPAFGEYQITQGGLASGDLVVAITEGGETPFVIGTAWQGLKAGAAVFFVYNNPADQLRATVQRSREVLEHPDIHNLDLSTGPMAVTGSTRMQAVTIELLVVGAALETAINRLLADDLTAGAPTESSPADLYCRRFEHLLKQLAEPASVRSIAAWAQIEREVYQQNGLVTYWTDSYLLDVLTDTTERAPTFMLPPFRPVDDTVSPCPWVMIKDPTRSRRQTWDEMLQRPCRGLDWDLNAYRTLNAPASIQKNPPGLGAEVIYRFPIGNEPDPSRLEAPQTAGFVLLVDRKQLDNFPDGQHLPFLAGFDRTGAIYLGPDPENIPDSPIGPIRCDLPDSPLDLWRHLAVKLVLNTVSTATMAALGRIEGNAMAWVSPSNKKLLDRGTRLIAQLAGCPYEQACIALFDAIEQVEQRRRRHEVVPSPVALAIETLQRQGTGRKV